MTPPEVSAKNISHSVRWVAMARLSSQLATFATTIFVLKFLTQAEYGLASLAFVFMGILDTIIDFGFGAALIQKQDLTDKETSSVFWLLACLAIAFVGIANFAAVFVALFFEQPELEELIRIISLAILASPVQIVYRARLSRELKLPLLSQCDLLGLIIRTLTTVCLAISGAGVWSIIIGFMAEKVCVAIVLVIAQKWLPQKCMDIASIKSLSSFGLKITGDRIIYFLLYRMDSIVIAKLLGTHALGLYSFAQQFVSAVLQIIQTTGVNVAYPLFSRYQDSEKLLPTFYSAERLVALIALPALLGISVVANDLVLATVGPSWERSAIYIQALAVAGIFQMMAALIPQLLNAINRTTLNLLINASSVILLPALLLVAIRQFGENGFLIALIVFQCLRYIAIFLTARLAINLKIKKTLEAWIKAAIPAVCMLAGIVLLQPLVAHATPTERLFLNIIIGAISYAIINLAIFRQETLGILQHLRQK